MSSRERKRAQLYEKKLRQLRAVTHSSSVDETSIIVGTSKYITELKEKVERLNQPIGSSETATHNQSMEVSVETLEKGFLINVYSERKCPGLLVCVLEAFEELGLDVGDANVSCADRFHFQAVGSEDETNDVVDAQVVKQAILQAINSWSNDK